MRVGIGLPNTVPGTGGSTIIEWACKADAGPFTSLGVLDRHLYSSYEPLAVLASAAGVTQRITLATTIVASPLHNTAVLAKIAESIQALSGGRLVLGLAVGARKDDYDAVGVEFTTRGRRFAGQLKAIRTMWEESPGLMLDDLTGERHYPPILIGGLSDVVYSRIARYADGYVHGGGPPRAFARAADKVRAAWLDSGRPGKPLMWGQGYFSLGSDEEAEAGRNYLRNYYAFTGPFAEKIAEGLLTTPQAVAGFLRGYAEAGCDEMVLFPTASNLAQLDKLADALTGL